MLAMVVFPELGKPVSHITNGDVTETCLLICFFNSWSVKAD